MGSCLSVKKSSSAPKLAEKLTEKEQSGKQEDEKTLQQPVSEEKAESHEEVINSPQSNIIEIAPSSTLAQNVSPYSTPRGNPLCVNFQRKYPNQPNPQVGTPGGYPPDVNFQAGYPNQQNPQAGGPGGFAKPGMQRQNDVQQQQCLDPHVVEWFRLVDTDGSGHIIAEELQEALVNGDYTQFSVEACRKMISMYDKNGSGCIDVYEFQELFGAINQWKLVFESYDRDQSGTIEQAELTQALQQMGYTFSPTFLQSLSAKYINRSKRLALDNFILICVELQRLTDCFRSKDHSMKGNANLKYEEFVGLAMGVYHY